MAGLGDVANTVDEMVREYMKANDLNRPMVYDKIGLRIGLHILHDYAGWKYLGSEHGVIEIKDGRLAKEPGWIAKEVYDRVNRYARNITYYSQTSYEITIDGRFGSITRQV